MMTDDKCCHLLIENVSDEETRWSSWRNWRGWVTSGRVAFSCLENHSHVPCVLDDRKCIMDKGRVNSTPLNTSEVKWTVLLFTIYHSRSLPPTTAIAHSIEHFYPDGRPVRPPTSIDRILVLAPRELFTAQRWAMWTRKREREKPALHLISFCEKSRQKRVQLSSFNKKTARALPLVSEGRKNSTRERERERMGKFSWAIQVYA